MNELLAKRSSLQDSKKKILEELTTIDTYIKETIGSDDQLTVNGGKVASIARWIETSIVTEEVKISFPIATYPELYKKTEKSRLTVH